MINLFYRFFSAAQYVADRKKRTKNIPKPTNFDKKHDFWTTNRKFGQKLRILDKNRGKMVNICIFQNYRIFLIHQKLGVIVMIIK